MLQHFFIKSICALIIFTLGAGHLNAQIYEIGPGKKYERISSIPFDELEPGDIVKIHYRKKPYREKFIIRRSGTKNRPIIITGIPKGGKIPVIDGRNAKQFQKENWPQSSRWLIKMGDGGAANYVQIKGLELRNANNSLAFIKSGKKQTYGDNAAGVFVRKGKHVLISGCLIHSCGNAVQTSYAPDVDNVTISECYIYDNGNHKNLNSSQEHNVYMCGTNTTIQFSRFGETHSDGNNIKDRGRGTVVRYNWIEGGKNRQLDLVDHKGYRRANAFVYGNLIVQGIMVHNNNMIHWGGDAGHSRSGTLYLFNNTIIGRAKQTRFILVRYPDCDVEIKNNIFIGNGKLWNGRGILKGSNNWFSSQISGQSFILGNKGYFSGFISIAGIPYFPNPGSGMVNLGTINLPKSVQYMPRPNTGGFRRPSDGAIDIGAYEFFNLKVQRQ